jgi:pantetheine-phosphate adenylyltransferase
VFLVSADRYAHISSSLIKQIAGMARGDVAEKLRDFVPSEIIAPLIQRLR